MRIVTPPTTFFIPESIIHQNPYIKPGDVNAMSQYKNVCKIIAPYEYVTSSNIIPDFVFIASAGLSLPRLPEPVVILPHMKYKQRRNELPHLQNLFEQLHVRTISYPGKEFFEGQAECAWFHNYNVLVVGYGQRSTKATVTTLRNLLQKVYKSYGVEPPLVIGIHLINPLFYHLDMALLSMDTYCIIQPTAFHAIPVSLNAVVFPYKDSFALNAIQLGCTLLVHKVKPQVKKFLETKTKLKVVEVDMSEYEKSGGSVRCIVFDLF